MIRQIIARDDDYARSVVFCAILAAINVGVWIWATSLFIAHPVLLGTAVLAYSLGLRHALDADHIAVIDNVTRKLLREERRPVGIGFFFALGHSLIVLLVVMLLAMSSAAVTHRLNASQGIGAILSTLISAIVLFAVGGANLLLLRRGREGQRAPGDASGTVLTRLIAPLLEPIRRSWHMIPIGFLFGLGFETGTEISVMGVSAAQVADGQSLWAVLLFPALFAAGMMLMDTADGLMMARIYRRGSLPGSSQTIANAPLTAASAVIALFVGLLEILQLVKDLYAADGLFWKWVTWLNDHFNTLGVLTVIMLLIVWLMTRHTVPERSRQALAK
jgi:nickel/cobalt transporter (NiCoT) family protein